MVSSTEGRIFCPQMHFQMLEEIVVFMRCEGDQHAHGPRQGREHQGVVPTRNQVGFLEWKRNENISYKIPNKYY